MRHGACRPSFSSYVWLPTLSTCWPQSRQQPSNPEPPSSWRTSPFGTNSASCVVRSRSRSWQPRIGSCGRGCAGSAQLACRSGDRQARHGHCHSAGVRPAPPVRASRRLTFAPGSIEGLSRTAYVTIPVLLEDLDPLAHSSHIIDSRRDTPVPAASNQATMGARVRAISRRTEFAPATESMVRLARRAGEGPSRHWHRQGFRLFWRGKSKTTGRARLPNHLQGLIREMAADNPTWGQERIANELQLKLGVRVSPRTVAKYLRRGGTVRTPDSQQRWLTFLR